MRSIAIKELVGPWGAGASGIFTTNVIASYISSVGSDRELQTLPLEP
jgi:hypothetical protein